MTCFSLCSFSTKEMRDPKLEYSYTATQGVWAGRKLKGGFAAIIEAVEKLVFVNGCRCDFYFDVHCDYGFSDVQGLKHKEHIAVYGKDNEFRLTGKHETASIDTWKYGVADRGASVRIPRDAQRKGCGYFEDRRPASNMDPYVVCGKIAETTLL